MRSLVERAVAAVVAALVAEGLIAPGPNSPVEGPPGASSSEASTVPGASQPTVTWTARIVAAVLAVIFDINGSTASSSSGTSSLGHSPAAGSCPDRSDGQGAPAGAATSVDPTGPMTPIAKASSSGGSVAAASAAPAKASPGIPVVAASSAVPSSGVSASSVKWEWHIPPAPSNMSEAPSSASAYRTKMMGRTVFATVRNYDQGTGRFHSDRQCQGQSVAFRMTSMTKEEALDRGLTPCLVCRP
jgi:hypothetical protein